MKEINRAKEDKNLAKLEEIAYQHVPKWAKYLRTKKYEYVSSAHLDAGSMSLTDYLNEKSRIILAARLLSRGSK